MPRRTIPVVLLVMACSLAGLAAGVLPVAGTYLLQESSEVPVINFPKAEWKDLPWHKPDSLKLDVPPLEFAYYSQLKLGAPVRPYYLVIGRRAQKWFDTLYFDRDGDGVITQKDQVEMAYSVQVYDDRLDQQKLELWFIWPADPLQVELTYSRADGTAVKKMLTVSLDILSIYVLDSSQKPNPFAVVSVSIGTCFVGEVAAGDGRILKVALVDGNQNGLFNEAKVDCLLLDSNYDSRFDWAKEKTPLGKELNGLDPEGKKVKLTPVVAAWPRRLCLAPKGATIDPGQLE